LLKPNVGPLQKGQKCRFFSNKKKQTSLCPFVKKKASRVVVWGRKMATASGVVFLEKNFLSILFPKLDQPLFLFEKNILL
jgi:hypothetical protein